MPKIGESHLNMINTLENPIVAIISPFGTNQTFELDSSSNHVIQNLKAGYEYCLNVQFQNKSKIGNDEVGLCFNATSKHVSKQIHNLMVIL